MKGLFEAGNRKRKTKLGNNTYKSENNFKEISGEIEFRGVQGDGVKMPVVLYLNKEAIFS